MWGPRGRVERWGRPVAAGLLAAVGGGTVLLHAAHALAGATPIALLVGSAVPVLVGVALLAGSGLLATRYEGEECLRVAAWTTAGVVIVGGLGLLVVLLEVAGGVTLVTPAVVVGDHVTVGAAVGVLVGLYDVRVRRTTDTLRERERTLADRTESLERLDRINAVIRGIDAVLVSAASRAEIERAVCERLVGTAAFSAAWVGRPRPHSGDIECVAAAGLKDRDVPADTPDRSVAAEAIRAGEPRRLADGGLLAGRAALAVPLTYEEAAYGVLVAYAEDGDVFDGETRAVLAELGGTIGLAMNALDRRDALVADTAVELEFRVDGADSLACRLAEAVGEPVTVRALVPRSDGSYSAVYESPRRVPEGALDGVDGRLIEDRTVHARVTGATPATKAADLGATPRDVSADADGERLVVELPDRADVRGFIEAFETAYPAAELVARRHRTRDPDDGEHGRAIEVLTPRQREVLETAYYSGYFEWPRETTGEELADLLGLSAPTVHQHLRTSHRKLLGRALDDGERPPQPN